MDLCIEKYWKITWHLFFVVLVLILSFNRTTTPNIHLKLRRNICQMLILLLWIGLRNLQILILLKIFGVILSNVYVNALLVLVHFGTFLNLSNMSGKHWIKIIY